MKRKHKSEMVKALPLPDFRTAKNVIICRQCRKSINKSDAYKAKLIQPYYLCADCIKGYTGSLIFKRVER